MTLYEFLGQNALYVVLIIVLLIWFGFLFYLLRLDRRVKHLEDTIQK